MTDINLTLLHLFYSINTYHLTKLKKYLNYSNFFNQYQLVEFIK